VPLPPFETLALVSDLGVGVAVEAMVASLLLLLLLLLLMLLGWLSRDPPRGLSG
jgi:hypothetical protein